MDYKRLAISLGAGVAGAVVVSAIGAQKSYILAAALVAGSGGTIVWKVKEDIENKKLSDADSKRELAAVDMLIFLGESDVLDVPETINNSKEYLDETEEVTEDFLQNWKSYSKETYDQICTFDPVIEVLFGYSQLLNNNYSCHSESHPPLQEWVRKALCASAMAIHFKTSRTDEWFKEEVREKVRYFVLNIRREWAEFLIQLLVFLDATEQTLKGIEKSDAYNKSLQKFVSNSLREIYEEINNDCTLVAQGMDSWVKKLMTKTSFIESDPPQLHINDIEDGRQEVFWGNKDSTWKHGRSCTYLVDWNGGACVKETNEFVVFRDWKQFPFIAATIIQDVFGPYDHESATKALGEDIKRYLVAKKREKVTEIEVEGKS